MKIAISGGSGTIGKHLSKVLIEAGHEVIILSRSTSHSEHNFQQSKWDPSKQELNENDLHGVNAVINLAGAPISQRWTKEAKEEIIESRKQSTSTLVNWLNTSQHDVKHFISASAIGLYPFSDKLQLESSPLGNHFMSEVCQIWEDEAKKVSNKISLTVVRIGVVLSKTGGALEKMKPPFKMGFGSGLGSGNQWMSWIHQEDLSSLFKFCLDQKVTGEINAVAPRPERNMDFSKSLAKAMNKPFWAPKVPEFVLKILLGEMSAIVLGSQKISAEKIQKKGFKFLYPVLSNALKNLLD